MFVFTKILIDSFISKQLSKSCIFRGLNAPGSAQLNRCRCHFCAKDSRPHRSADAFPRVAVVCWHSEWFATINLLLPLNIKATFYAAKVNRKCDC